MSWLVVLLLLIVALVLLVFFSRSEVVPWLDNMRRVQASPTQHGEWLAPEAVIDAVIAHYREYLNYAQHTLIRGWVHYDRNLDQYLTGEHLAIQRTHLDARLRRGGLRLIDILRANHEIRVRHFSDDGATCLLLDYQTERRLATYTYWGKRRVHTQHLPDAICVFRMRFDPLTERWKIAESIQELPPVYYLDAINGPIDKLDIAMPDLLGRDQ